MEEKQVKPKSTGKTVTIIILIVLLLGLGGYTAYDKLVLDKNTKDSLENTKEDLEIANREKKEANEKVTKLEKDTKKLSETEENNYIISTYRENDMHIYAIGYGYLIYTYNGQLYISSVNEPSLADSDECLGIDNITTSSNPTRSGDGYKTKNLNLTEQELNKVRVKTIYNSSDAISIFYIIKKDGTVKKYTLDDSGLNHMTNKTVLSNYKVKDLEVTCSASSKTCDNPSYKLKLQDGTTKTVNEK